MNGNNFSSVGPITLGLSDDVLKIKSQFWARQIRAYHLNRGSPSKLSVKLLIFDGTLVTEPILVLGWCLHSLRGRGVDGGGLDVQELGNNLFGVT